ncbi:cysteine methyltransferase [Helicobacter didelphidarum]|uniref:methylated-DNA--[protein]-cysteine S-methyltransferase n=1 Tax=Helicobacter didelphidarum TaxID=2040648 RepID=A0A3D8ILZ6_9HELI|nr:methylated-DNA--[protein]-cysteine S-methyltransferase [Helicobacter didelphidarum]RDU66202.1 cysteine methyltransferase [Helicobacter didelphidarum]
MLYNKDKAIKTHLTQELSKKIDNQLYKTLFPSMLGNITLIASANMLHGLFIDGQDINKSLLTNTIELREDENLTIFNWTKAWLECYFRGHNPIVSSQIMKHEAMTKSLTHLFSQSVRLPIYPQGTRFQMEVWEILCAIPYGEVISYGEIARILAQRLGIKKMSAQAVGGAVGKNPISIIIPCHRVLGSGSRLTGYNGGVELKSKLLELEGIEFKK